MDLIISNLPLLLNGLLNTILMSLCCLIISVVMGIIVGVLRTIKLSILVFLSRLYIELLRGIPVLVTLYLIYFVLPTLGVYVNAFLSAVIGLSLWASANVAESVRGAIQSIPKTQAEAGQSLGLNGIQTMRYVIVPQAIRRVVPSIIGILIILIHTTSLTVLIGNREFLKTAQIIIERTIALDGISVSLLLYVIVLIGYFIICYPLSIFGKRLEKKLSLGS